MLNSDQTLTIDTVDHVVKRINQDNFGSTYFLKNASGTEFQLKIRHSRQGRAGIDEKERHIADFTVTSFDSDGKASVNQSYIHIITPRGTDTTAAINEMKALLSFVDTNAVALVGWES